MFYIERTTRHLSIILLWSYQNIKYACDFSQFKLGNCQIPVKTELPEEWREFQK